jgi:hypothetical protein
MRWVREVVIGAWLVRDGRTQLLECRLMDSPRAVHSYVSLSLDQIELNTTFDALLPSR